MNTEYNNAIKPEQIAMLGKYKLVQAKTKKGAILGWAYYGDRILTLKQLANIATYNILPLQAFTISRFGTDVEDIVIN